MIDKTTPVVPAHRSDDSLSPKISEAAARLHAARPDAAIVLFGSHARDEAHAGSDVDFLVVLPEAPTSPRQEMARLCQLLYPLQVWADVLVTSVQRFRESAAVPGTLHHSIAREGKVLYGSLG
jgi:predicted nucleotidyltransferase